MICIKVSLGGGRVGAVIAVLSGKGGTGKTTVCAGLAVGLASLGKRVLCVDLDMGLRNLDIALGMAQVPALSFLDILRGEAGFGDAAAHPDFSGLRFLTAPVGLGYEALDLDAFERMLQSVRQTFDFCLLDAPAGVGDGFRVAARASVTQLLVTGPDPAALRDGARTGELLELMGKTDVRLVVNRVNPKLYDSMGLTVDDVMDLVGYRLLGLVPEDRKVPLAAVHDKALLQYERGGAAAACRRMARRLLGEPVPLAKIK